ncbi:MAG: 4-hydroxy-tetrahydrodipicolinate reductase [Nannocystaceae bacterium]
MNEPERLTPIVIVGARGRMGTALIREVIASDTLVLDGAVDRSGGRGRGQDAGVLAGLHEIGVTVTDSLSPRRNTVVVDFSLPEATDNNIRRCRDAGVPLVLGTTGLGPESIALLREAAKLIPIISAANFSVGITLLTRLAEIAARALGDDWEAEIFELHHKHKRDAPSGTALRIGKAVARATGRTFSEVAVTSRGGPRSRPREPEEIGITAARGGDSAGEHTLMFLTEGERLEITHRANDRKIFARGALRAAEWIAMQGPGLYDMSDVLGLSALS